MDKPHKDMPIPRQPRPPLKFTNDVAQIPDGHAAPLDDRTTLELMADRDRDDAKTT